MEEEEKYEDEILELWAKGDDISKERAIEKAERREFKDARGSLLLGAFKREMFDFIANIESRTFRKGWESVLFQAGKSGDLKLISRVMEYVSNNVIKNGIVRDWRIDERESQILFGQACGGHCDQSLFSAGKHKNMEEYILFVKGIIYSKSNQNWEKLNLDDVKKIMPQDRLYTMACRFENHYVLQKLKELSLVPYDLRKQLICFLFLGDYENFRKLLPSTNGKIINNLFQIITSCWNKSSGHQKIFNLLINQFNLQDLYSPPILFFSASIKSTNNGGPQKYSKKKIFYHSISNSGSNGVSIASLLININICTSSLKKWIYDVDDLEVLIKSGFTNLEPIRKRLPELFCHQNLFTLFLRQEHILTKTNCTTTEELKNFGHEANSIKNLLLQYLYPRPLVDIVICYF